MVDIANERFDGRVDGVGEGSNGYAIDGEEHLFPELFGFRHHLFAVIYLRVVNERFAYFFAHSFYKGISHAAADDKRVALFEQVGNNVELIRNLRAAENCYERTNGVFERVSHNGKFFFD